jgi:ureidoacrylate peracid hydrolase
MPSDDAPGRPRRWTSTPDEVVLAPKPRVASLVTVPANPQAVTFDLARTAIVVVDMQNDFCHPEGWLSSIGVDTSGAAAIIPALADLLGDLRGAGVPVIWLNWGNRPDKINLPPNVIHVYDPVGTGGGIGEPATPRSTAVLTEGSWGAAIVDELPVAAQDIHIPKYRMSGFWDTVLDSTLRALRVDHVLFAGVNVDQCVLATLIDASCAGYDCLLVTGATATTSPSYCADATFYNVRQCFGFVVDCPDVVAAVKPLGADA